MFHVEHAPALVLGVATLTYLTYHYGLAADVWETRLSDRYPAETAQTISVLVQRVGGGLVLGAAAAFVMVLLGEKGAATGLALPDWHGWVWAVAGWLLLAPLLLRASSRPVHWVRYPQMRTLTWDRRRWAVNALGWSAYLAGYEFFFRGLLVIYLAHWLGAVTAVAVSSGLYALAHLNKEAGETFGSLLMGGVFGAIALQSGSVWPCWLLHTLIALTSDTGAMRSNPALSWKGKG